MANSIGLVRVSLRRHAPFQLQLVLVPALDTLRLRLLRMMAATAAVAVLIVLDSIRPFLLQFIKNKSQGVACGPRMRWNIS